MERKQLLIAVDRTFGSDGEKVADLLAQRLQLKVYGGNLLREVSGGFDGAGEGALAEKDEKPPALFLRRHVRGFAYSTEEILAETVFHHLREMADQGESFIVIGHCGDAVLEGRAGLVRVFITSDWETRVENVARNLSVCKEEAARYILRQDKRLEHYHNNFTSDKWACSLHYDLCINSSRLGEENTACLLTSYIRGLPLAEGM